MLSKLQSGGVLVAERGGSGSWGGKRECLLRVRGERCILRGVVQIEGSVRERIRVLLHSANHQHVLDTFDL